MDSKIVDRCLTSCRLVLFLASALVMIGCYKSSPTSNPLIRYGTPAATHKNDSKMMDYKWVARLRWGLGSIPEYACTGSLFTDRHVLTAAHCVVDLDKMESGKFKIKSDVKLAVTFGYGTPESEVYGIEKIDLHPNFNAIDLNNLEAATEDLAVVTLDRSVSKKFSESLPEIVTEYNVIEPLINSLWLNDRHFKAFGYGYTETGTPSNQLLYAELNANLISTCKKSLASFVTLSTTDRYKYEYFCTVGNLKGPSTNHGDSGGPALIWKGGKSKIVGVAVMSYSGHYFKFAGRCQPGKLSIFKTLLHPQEKTKIWIESFVNRPFRS